MIASKTPLSILKQLIAIPSQNPMGHEPVGDGWYEAGVSRWLCEFFKEHSLPYEYHEIESQRGNVVARIDGDPNRPTVLLDAHQDTVPVAGMIVDPYDAIEKEGRLYGRGTCDVKGSMAAMLATAIRLIPLNGDHAPVILSFTCDEERTQIGAAELARRLALPAGQRSALLPENPQFAIVCEPTDLNVVVAHKGTVRWKIRTCGAAAHSSNPALGVNAIYKMAKIVSCLEAYAAQLQSGGIVHPLCGGRTLSVGTIHGGASVNIVPEQCTIEIDRRLVPGEVAEEAIAAVDQYLRENCDVDFEFLPTDTISNPLLDRDNAALGQQLIEAAEPTRANRQAIGVPFGTHAPRIAALEIPTVVFGPGSIDQAHTKDEWIEIQQLDEAVDIFVRFLTKK